MPCWLTDSWVEAIKLAAIPAATRTIIMRADDQSLDDPPDGDRPGDSWMCGRMDGESRCAGGPMPDGRCRSVSSCRPVHTWHGRRRFIVSTTLTATAGVLIALLISVDAPTLYKPGPLSTAHAQILSGTLESQRCAACHPGGASTARPNFDAGRRGHENVSQTDRCLNCHHVSIRRETATTPHNLPPAAIAAIRVASSASPTDSSWHDRMPRPAAPDRIQCSACHREHRGAQGDLLAIHDTQCQSCHHDRFASFANGHPDWGDWPYRRGGEIHFDHASHLTRHFVASGDLSPSNVPGCADCHPQRPGPEVARTVSYDSACRSCHDAGLRLQTARGVELIALPMLTAEASRRSQPWPDAATGFYDGKVAPIAQWLFRSDPATSEAIRSIGGGDLSQLDDSEASVEVAAQIATAHRELLDAIAEGGQPALSDRLSAIGIPPSQATELVRSLSPQLIVEARRRWFEPAGRRNREVYETPAEPSAARDQAAVANRLGEVTLTGDLLTGDLLMAAPNQVDPLDRPLASPTGQPTGVSIDASSDWSRLLPSGGWYRDDTRLSIGYRGGGHTDPVLKSVIEMLATRSAADVTRQQLLATPAIAACVSCHPAAVDQRRTWTSQPRIGGTSTDFTRFAHGPHLNIAALSDCVHCHRIDRTAVILSETDRPATSPVEFQPISRQSCADCHHPQAAGDGCIKCHRYHVGQPEQSLRLSERMAARRPIGAAPQGPASPSADGGTVD
jgi:hypothetical protein